MNIPLRSLPRFAMVVPARSVSAADLEATINSVRYQRASTAGRCTLRIVVVGSDLSQECLDLLEDLESEEISLAFDSGHGLYPALAQGFQLVNGDYYGYLGVGDVLEPQAFDLILETAPSDVPVKPWWVTGLILGRRSDGAIVRVMLPFRYRSRFFDVGLYGTRLPTLQQESTFWNSYLHSRIDWQKVERCRLAGDFELWRQFSAWTTPVILEAALGSFRWHGSNMSGDWETYVSEVKGLTSTPSALDRIAARLELLMWALPNRLKLRFAKGSIRRFSWPEGPWQSQ